MENENEKIVDDYFERFLQWREIENVCKKCNGTGRLAYGNTSTWHHGIGGQSITGDVCEFCWGTGDMNRKGADLRNIYNETKRLKESIKEKDNELQLALVELEQYRIALEVIKQTLQGK